LSLEREYFDAMYAANSDPWSFDRRWYDHRKYALTVAALPRERYSHGLEIGCSIGRLTGMLASRCDGLLAVDISAAAIVVASRRVLPASVTLEQRSIPRQWPRGVFDLIVMSEVGYYWDTTELDQTIALASSALSDGGHVVAVHWREQVEDYPLNAKVVHETLRARSDLCVLASYSDPHFLLDVLGKGARSQLQGPD
jgi:predicted TPR repeat methyltransferase